MSTLSQFLGGGVKSIQTGFYDGSAFAGTGEDTKYINITISAVDTNKAFVYLQPVVIGAGYRRATTARLTNSTTLRLSEYENIQDIIARWYVIEYY